METLAVRAQPAALAQTRLVGWLLALQLIGWLGAIFAGLANFPPSEFDSWTAATLAGVQAPWLLFHVFIALAVVVGSAGLACQHRGLQRADTRGSSRLSADRPTVPQR
jgi:hypothetical protein